MKLGKKSVSRRGFIKAAGAAIALPNIITSKALGAADGTPPASERVTLAIVGAGGQGTGVLSRFRGDKRVQFVAACDVKFKELDKFKNDKSVKIYTDYREICARDDIDFVLCGTPDHWHAQVTIDAMKSGKDIFCEKPLSLTIDEGRKMSDTARKYGRVFSCGSQRVIGDYGKSAAAANSGVYGEVLAAHADPGGPPRHCFLGKAKTTPEQDGIDWDMWLGPAPWAPYHPYRCGRGYGLGGKGFRTWYDYSGGMMTDWGGHKFGGAMHGLKLDHTGPTAVVHPSKDNGYKHLTYEFANGKKLFHGGGQKFICEKGEAKAQGNLKVPPGLRWYEGGATDPYKDVINCVYSRKRPFRDVEYAHRVATICHLGNIAYMLDRDLKWDPDKEVFIGDDEANRLISRPRREPWQI
ncbi:MAG: Gfo/Idh/MocA family oxidoreductase [Kiritimatiellae bacterium]|nr:Gfo/Idh/MocA family oxidoreductase [Kiritimatiellia bacterium]